MSRAGPLHVRVLTMVALGGALGACLRYGLNQAMPDHTTGFPWTTFAINVIGSLLLALLPSLAAVRRSRLLTPFLGTGVLGGFTTLSAYSEQTRSLLSAGDIATATVYLVGTLAACLAAVAVADRLSTATERAAFKAREGDE